MRLRPILAKIEAGFWSAATRHGVTMADSFDPYHKWLGIPPKDQPPNHYRLLAIELFESDPDVIESAADQRMAHVRTFQAGQNSALSQRILNELSAAKICLINTQKKSDYDRQLRRDAVPPAVATQRMRDGEIEGPSGGHPPLHPSVPPSLPLASGPSPRPLPQAKPLPVQPPVPVVVASSTSTSGIHRRTARKRPAWQQPAVLAGAGAAVVLLACVVYFVATAGKSPTAVIAVKASTAKAAKAIANSSGDTSDTMSKPLSDTQRPVRATKLGSKGIGAGRIAQRVLSIGGALTVRVAEGPAISVKQLAELPPGDFDIIGVDLSNMSVNVNEELKHLPELTGLEAVSLLNCRVDDNGLAYLGRVPSLVEVGLECTQTTDAGLPHLASLPKLRYLNLRGDRITDAGLLSLSKMKSLEDLTLDNTQITDDGLRTISAIPSLTRLDLRNTIISDAGLRHLKSVTRLQQLDLRNTDTSDAALRHLQSLKHLRVLYPGRKMTLGGTEELRKYLPDLAAPGLPAPAAVTRQPIDLLKTLDVKRDCVAGDWQMGDGILTTPDGAYSLLMLPAPPAAEYRLTVRAERVQGSNTLAAGLVVGGRPVMAEIDAWESKFSGLDKLDYGTHLF